MRIDLTGVEDRSFEALPAGRYKVKLTDYEMRETKGAEGAKLPKGTPMINWEFTVVSDTKGDEQYKNRKLWSNSIIHPTTMFNLKRLLKASGLYSEEDLQGDLDFDPEEIVGNSEEMVAVVSQRTYNGDQVNDVKRLIGMHEIKEEESSKASLLP